MKKLTAAGCYGRLVLPGIEKNVIDDPSEIMYVCAEDHYIYVYLADGSRRMLTICLKYIGQRLDPCMFFRSHKSCIINLNFVKCYRRHNRCIVAKLADGNEICVAKRLSVNFINRLNGSAQVLHD